ncbi:uncharacterized protein LOC114366374 [Ostrinia furnacalis]|uniref:uncharacterized protein LOC114366374 n=1 Tax=Ostrinia furnacalis TaxID=93504 RepID=UPI001039C2A5|nr:uncharacterized protein LOC114366374 [Ostrinia furnacalis]
MKFVLVCFLAVLAVAAARPQIGLDAVSNAGSGVNAASSPVQSGIASASGSALSDGPLSAVAGAATGAEAAVTGAVGSGLGTITSLASSVPGASMLGGLTSKVPTIPL